MGRMRSDRRRLSRPPLVGIAVEGVTEFGRSIIRGVLKYANLQRGWVLHKDLWLTTRGALRWPECDGTIIAGVPSVFYDEVLLRSRYVVSCSGSHDHMTDVMPVVALDDDAAAAMAAQHLLDRCLQNFAFYGPSWEEGAVIGGITGSTPARRSRGFVQALAQHGRTPAFPKFALPSHRDLLTHAHHPKLVRWLQGLPKPVGILAVDDMLANDLAEACRGANLGVPEQVAIIGINNDELLCESAWPPISSVEADFSRMGYQASKTLDRMLHGETLPPAERLVRLPPIRIEQRMSTDLLATRDPDVAEAIRFIRSHACDPCSVGDVVNVVAVARRSLERQFVAQLGRTPSDEINRVRMDVARQLLLQPDLPIRSIADRCGFSGIQGLNRSFLRTVGVTPATFRRQSLRSTARP